MATKRPASEPGGSGSGPPPTKKLMTQFEPVRIGPIMSLEELDVKVLQFQNRKLAERIEQRRKNEDELRKRIEQLEQRQTTDDAVLCIVNRYWNQLDEDVRVLLQRFDAEGADELGKKNESPAVTSFLTLLSQWDRPEIEEKLSHRVLFSKRAIGKLLQAYDRLLQRNEKLWDAIKEKDDQAKSGSSDIKKENKEDDDESDDSKEETKIKAEPMEDKKIKKEEEDKVKVKTEDDDNAKDEAVFNINDSLRQDMDRLISENKRLQNLVTELQQKHHELNLKGSEIFDQLNAAETQAAELKNTVEELEYNCTNQSSQIDKLDRLLSDAYTKLSSMKEGDIKCQGGGEGVSKNKFNEILTELEEQKELATNRLTELEKLQKDHQEAMKNIEQLKIDLSTLPEHVIVETTEYKCLQSQFSVLYNESMQIKTQLEDSRSHLANSKNVHLRQIEQMEGDELQCQKKLRTEVIQLEDDLSRVRREYDMLRIEFEQTIAANEQTGPINREMRHLISSLKNHNEQLKGELQRTRKKLKEASAEIIKLTESYKYYKWKAHTPSPKPPNKTPRINQTPATLFPHKSPRPHAAITSPRKGQTVLATPRETPSNVSQPGSAHGPPVLIPTVYVGSSEEHTTYSHNAGNTRGHYLEHSLEAGSTTYRKPTEPVNLQRVTLAHNQSHHVPDMQESHIPRDLRSANTYKHHLVESVDEAHRITSNLTGKGDNVSVEVDRLAVSPEKSYEKFLMRRSPSVMPVEISGSIESLSQSDSLLDRFAQAVHVYTARVASSATSLLSCDSDKSSQQHMGESQPHAACQAATSNTDTVMKENTPANTNIKIEPTTKEISLSITHINMEESDDLVKHTAVNSGTIFPFPPPLSEGPAPVIPAPPDCPPPPSLPSVCTRPPETKCVSPAYSAESGEITDEEQLKSEASQSASESDKANAGDKNSADAKQSSPTNGGKGEGEGSSQDKVEDPLLQMRREEEDRESREHIAKERSKGKTDADIIKELRAELKKSQDRERDLKLLLDMYKSAPKENRDKVQMMNQERKARQEIEELKSHIRRMQEAERRERRKLAEEDAIRKIKKLEESIAELQKCLAAQKQEEETLLNEMEVTGQAFEDMQEQNIRLLQQLREKDDANFKLMSERIKSNQIHKLLREEKNVLVEQVMTLQTQVESQNQVVRKLEEKERILQSNLAVVEKELTLRQQALELHKRKAVESSQTAADLKLHLDKYHAQLKESQLAVSEKSSASQQQSFKYKRQQEDIAALRRKVERAKKIELASSADEVLMEEIKEYKEQLTCPSCKVKKKDAVLTKCYHVFCLECLKTRYETRQRKCPKCNAIFGANDYHRIFLE